MYSLIIVEDERSERECLIRIVPWKEMGFVVDGVFRNGSECLEYLKSNTPDVILTDIKMAKMNGLDIASYVAEKNLQIQIVFMSAYKEFEYAQKAVEYGVFYYLVKPFPLPQLKEIFGKVRKKLDDQREKNGATGKGSDHNQHNTKYGKSIVRVMNYIEEHYNEDLSLNTISEKLFLNPGYVSRKLKEQTGKNYTDIVAEMRINRAVWLLENTDLYVYEIAEQVGYQNLKYFYRIFKKVTGKVPNDYREGPYDE